ncbi:MAG: hypothetical protein PHF56_02640 [Desulfuromonadaceae bacterium]|nr:hypothetical protein [Desulfuromonadaceae bacterium]
MNVLEELKKLGGRAGGITIYYGAKSAAAVANVAKQTNKLNARSKAKFRPLFPHLDLDRVRIRPACDLPGNWFESEGGPHKVVAMTFGYTIYCKGTHMQRTYEKLNILMHELVHIEQIRCCGNSETEFAGDYGEGFLDAGNYRQNPLEEEAYDFVEAYHFTSM